MKPPPLTHTVKFRREVMEQDLREQLAVVWRALHSYRHDLIPEGIDKGYDEEWDEICGSMASITEELGLDSVAVD
jgi:hypothetical protein